MGWTKHIWFILVLFFSIHIANGKTRLSEVTLDFFGDTIHLSPAANTQFIDFQEKLSKEAVVAFYDQMESAHYEPVINALLAYQAENKPDDWLYYQLIRKTAQAISPKEKNYVRYTLYKWFFLLKSGYDASVCVAGDTILFYVQCDENIYDIPRFVRNNKQYICLNYHDYGFKLELKSTLYHEVRVHIPQPKTFSYKLTNIPDFKPSDYRTKDIHFDYQDVSYHFNVKINDQVKNLFANYPVADYQLYFNVPMSRETYNSLIPRLKEITSGMNVRGGIDYLMHLTRYGLLYQPDSENFGREKRLNPEQTLLYEKSDCEDRAALFFYLVKEIYNLPMIVIAYPTHVNIAVKLDKARGKPILYNGEKYYVCEPTPQARNLRIGEVSKELWKEQFEIAYAYNP